MVELDAAARGRGGEERKVGLLPHKTHKHTPAMNAENGSGEYGGAQVSLPGIGKLW